MDINHCTRQTGPSWDDGNVVSKGITCLVNKAWEKGGSLVTIVRLERVNSDDEWGGDNGEETALPVLSWCAFSNRTSRETHGDQGFV